MVGGSFSGYTRSSQDYQQQVVEAQTQRDFFIDTNVELNHRINELQKEIEELQEQIKNCGGNDVSWEELIEENNHLKEDNESLREQIDVLSAVIDQISDIERHLVTLSETSYDGQVTISNMFAAEGEKISVKLEPAIGFRVICTDSIGNTIMSNWDEGAWQFIMPSSAVTVEIIVQ